MNNALSWEQGDTLAAMASLLVQQPGEPEVNQCISTVSLEERIEEIRCIVGFHEGYVDRWVDDHSLSPDRLSELAVSCSRRVLQKLVSYRIEPEPEFLKWFCDFVENNQDGISYWEVDPRTISLAPEGPLEHFVRAMCALDYALLDRQAVEFCYRVLRNTSLKADRDYVKRLGHMKHAARQKSTMPGGKLHRTATQWGSIINHARKGI